MMANMPAKTDLELSKLLTVAQATPGVMQAMKVYEAAAGRSVLPRQTAKATSFATHANRA